MREDLVYTCLDIGLGFSLVEPAIVRYFGLNAGLRLMWIAQSEPEGGITAKLLVNVKTNHLKDKDDYTKRIKINKRLTASKDNFNSPIAEQPTANRNQPHAPIQSIAIQKSRDKLTRPRRGYELCQCSNPWWNPLYLEAGGEDVGIERKEDLITLRGAAQGHDQQPKIRDKIIFPRLSLPNANNGVGFFM